MRAWLALKEAGVAFDEEVVDIRRPQRFANLRMIGSFSPPAAVPVLVTGATVIFDSLAIMEYANDRSGGRLLPEALEVRAHARSIMAWQHSGLSGICARLSFESAFYPLKRAATAGERAESGRLFAFFEQLLAESGGPCLFGALSLADLTLVPTLLRLSRHDLHIAGWRHVEAWVVTMLARPSVREWVDEADRHPHIWYDDYLPPDQSPYEAAAAAVAAA